jgi:hypothetical protein
MSHTKIDSRLGSSQADFHLLSKHRWNDEVARIVKASKVLSKEWSSGRPN